MQRGAIGATVSRAYRKKEELLGQQVESARCHGRIEAVPHPAQGRRVVRKRAPEIADQLDATGCAHIAVRARTSALASSSPIKGPAELTLPPCLRCRKPLGEQPGSEQGQHTQVAVERPASGSGVTGVKRGLADQERNVGWTAVLPARRYRCAAVRAVPARTARRCGRRAGRRSRRTSGRCRWRSCG